MPLISGARGGGNPPPLFRDVLSKPVFLTVAGCLIWPPPPYTSPSTLRLGAKFTGLPIVSIAEVPEAGPGDCRS